MSGKRKMHWIPRTLPGGGGTSFRPAWQIYASSRPELIAPGTLIPSGICKYPILFPACLAGAYS
ncbi:MAG TPA: hypothetical protein VN414_06090 [Methanosarcina sp.]|nr:hypothetical protein [Methanosarcina sp.]